MRVSLGLRCKQNPQPSQAPRRMKEGPFAARPWNRLMGRTRGQDEMALRTVPVTIEAVAPPEPDRTPPCLNTLSAAG
jgi:hypothetical protein